MDEAGEILTKCAQRSLATSYSSLQPPSSAKEFRMNHRTAMALGLAELTTQHHAVICTLIMDDHHPSARALTRPCVEAALRSVWISRLATDKEVDAAIKGERNGWPTLEGLMGRVGGRTGISKMLRAFVPPTSWLNEMTHGGTLSSMAVLPEQVSDSRIVALRHGMTMVSLMAAEHVLALARINILFQMGETKNAVITADAFEDCVAQTTRDADPVMNSYIDAFKQLQGLA